VEFVPTLFSQDPLQGEIRIMKLTVHGTHNIHGTCDMTQRAHLPQRRQYKPYIAPRRLSNIVGPTNSYSRRNTSTFVFAFLFVAHVHCHAQNTISADFRKKKTGEWLDKFRVNPLMQQQPPPISEGVNKCNDIHFSLCTWHTEGTWPYRILIIIITLELPILSGVRNPRD
jgi:hypothetical protein